MQILTVDDDDFALSVLDSTLSRMGYAALPAHDGKEALNILQDGKVRLVITDWDMPGMNGIELCRAIRREDLSGYVYVIMLTGREGAQQRMEGLFAGADAFLNKPLDPEELLVCLKNAERVLSLETRDVTLFALAKLAESRDPDTGAHVERVQNYSRLIAQHLSAEVKACNAVDDEYIRLLYQTSPLHDLGKVGIPDAVLLKPGKLIPDEFTIMKTHALLGAQTLDAALHRFPNACFLQMARDIAATHHEKFDGSGYPQGLVADQIPMCGRIVAIADVYDALTSRRVYKSATTHEESKAIIVRESGGHFDPDVVAAFLAAEPEILAIRERLKDVDAAPQANVPQLPIPPDRAVTRACKIVVVEDDAILLQKVCALLAATGETVVAASSGEEAMEVIEEHGPQLVLSDWVMPGMDGLALCRQIRARQHADPVHFIMLTAHSDKSRLLEAYEAGVDDFVAKPFDTEELLARVRAGVRAAMLTDEITRKSGGSRVLNAQLATVNSRLEKLSITDELTGLFNRRHAMLRLGEQWAMADRYSRPLSIALIDIDHFKRINDTCGHSAGDAILRGVADVIQGQVRGTDTACRVGGEEFLLIFPSQTTQEARICAERCRLAVERREFKVNETARRVTISIGIAGRTSHMAQFTDLLQDADQAMYAAKHAGRNVVCIAEHVEGKDIMAGNTETAASSRERGPAPIDPGGVLKRCGGDAKFAAAVTQRFQGQAGGEVQKIANAMAAGNVDIVRRSAHNLKSMCAYMGARAAADLAGQIEDLGRDNRVGDVAPVLERLGGEVERAIAWIVEQNEPELAPSA